MANGYAKDQLQRDIDEYLKTPGSTVEQAIDWFTRSIVAKRQEALVGGYQLSPQVAEIWNAEIVQAARSLHSAPALQ